MVWPYIKVCENRSRVMHRKYQSSRAHAIRQRLKLQLETLYDLKDLVGPRHRNTFFECDIATHALKTKTHLTIRLESGPIQASIKQAGELDRDRVRALNVLPPSQRHPQSTTFAPATTRQRDTYSDEEVLDDLTNNPRERPRRRSQTTSTLSHTKRIQYTIHHSFCQTH